MNDQVFRFFCISKTEVKRETESFEAEIFKSGRGDDGEMEQEILERLTEYGSSGMYPFHMPGHKRRELPGGVFPSPYSVDITEIDGFDNLHHPEGILRESMEWAAGVYGADRSYYLVNGSTCGILSAVSAAIGCGQTILMGRGCHKSAYNAAIVNRLRVEYVYPSGLGLFGIPGGIRPEDVERALVRNEKSGRKIRAVLLASPTYEGVVSDIRRIAQLAHERGIMLIVDEAHGAHFSFSGRTGDVEDRRAGFPWSALDCGADIVIQSLHKTLPSFTQTAILHVKSRLVDVQKLELYLSVFQSSSPSYLFLAGIERCLRYMNREGREQMRVHAKRMRRLNESLGAMKKLRVLDRSIVEEGSAYDLDLSKVVVSTRDAADLDGGRLFRLLRDKYRLELEMFGPEHVTALTSIMDSDEGLERLQSALLEIDRDAAAVGGSCGREGGAGRKQGPQDAHAGVNPCRALPPAETVLAMAEAMERPGEAVPFSSSAGRISREFLYLYPPGIPILAPGERITETIISTVQAYIKNNLPVQGPADPSVSMILAVAKGRGDVVN